MIARNYIKSVSNTIIKTFVVFLVGILLARNLSQDDYGTFYYKLQLINFLSVVLSMGLGQGLLSLIKTQNRKISDAYSHIFFHILLVVILGIVFIKINPNNEFDFVVFVGIILGITVQIVSFVSMNSLDGIDKNITSSIVSSIYYLICVTIAVNIFEITYSNVLFVLFSSYMLRILMLLDYKNLVTKIKTDFVLYKVSFPFFFNALLLTGLLRLDVLFLRSRLGPESIALYGVSLTLAEIVLLVPSALGSILYPSLLSSDSDLSRRKEFRKILVVNTAIAGLAVLLLFVSGSVLVKLLYGVTYSESGRLLKFLLPGVISLSIVYSISNAINAKGGVGYGAIVLSLGLITNLTIMWCFVDDIGVLIGPISSSVAYVLTSVGFVLLGFKYKIW